jgi:hypothetical protein
VQISDSELSVLIDEPPKRSKKSKTKDKVRTTAMTASRISLTTPQEKGKAAANEKKQKKSSVELSKDEETIKRLKVSFIYSDSPIYRTLTQTIVPVTRSRMWGPQSMVKSIPGDGSAFTADQAAEGDASGTWHDWANEYGTSESDQAEKGTCTGARLVRPSAILLP